MYGVGKVPNIRTISSYRGEVLIIDLGKTFYGKMIAWMRKRDSNGGYHRSFEVIDNRYLKLSREKSLDYYQGGELYQSVLGRWDFEVKVDEDVDLGGEYFKTVYRGSIYFEPNITGATKITDDNNTTLETELQVEI